MVGRERSKFAESRADAGIAGVVGAVLLLAVAVTAYAHAVTTEVPRWGEDAEHAWESEVAVTWNALARDMGGNVGRDGTVTVKTPAPPAARALDVPLIGRTEPLRPSGTVTFEPACASFTANHTPQGGSVVNDLTTGSRGCLVFRADPAYSAPYAYHMEFGSVLRVQGDRAVVLTGPPLEIVPDGPDTHRVALTLPTLRGAPQTISADGGNLHVDLLPGPASSEVAGPANAANATWALNTAYPGAWSAWFTAQFSGAGVDVSTFDVACDPVDCTVGADGKGRVVVTIDGPHGDRNDVALAISYGAYDTVLR